MRILSRKKSSVMGLWQDGVVLAAAALTLVAVGSQPASAVGLEVPMSRPAMMTPLAVHALMLAVTQAGTSRTVAVGERGIVLISDDEGAHWRQASVPVSVTLTTVQFIDAERGWAAGHSGLILHTEDGGEHWARQLDGAAAAQLTLKEAEALPGKDALANAAIAASAGEDDAAAPTAPRKSASQIALANARRLVKEGADKPFLSLSFSDAQHGTAVGAYGIVVHTDDGGRTWGSWTARIGDVRGLHLYAIRQRGGEIWVAGEQGFVAHSTDRGGSFTVVNTPYKGSFFALGVGHENTVLLGGLRGNAVRSTDGGATFKAFKLGGDAAIADITCTSDGKWLLVTQNGQIYVSHDDANTFQRLLNTPVFRLNSISAAPSGAIIGAGFAGAAPVAFVAKGGALPTTRSAASIGIAGGQP